VQAVVLKQTVATPCMRD